MIWKALLGVYGAGVLVVGTQRYLTVSRTSPNASIVSRAKAAATWGGTWMWPLGFAGLHIK